MQWPATVFLLTIIATVSHAQILLVPGPQQLVPEAPRFIAAADFNNDGTLDGAVTNLTSTRVTALLVNNSGVFGSQVSLDIGRTLLGLQAGDLNNDGNADIAVADFLDFEVFVALGTGSGTFNAPNSYKLGSQPFDVAIGNFDNQKGNDLAVVYQNGTVSVLLNLGGDTGFAAPIDYPAGSKLSRVKAADLNGDGFDDIILINSGTTGSDDVSVLLNDGAGGFQTATSFAVDPGAADLAIADFNGDGIPDVAVVTPEQVSQRTYYSISILLNQAQVVNGRSVGTGNFTGQPAVQVPCPTSIGGVPIYCGPNFIAAGDFDDDGLMDLAITVSTQPQAGVTPTSGLVMAFKGKGNGEFDFSEQVIVGVEPQGIVAGDFDGDGLTDVAIAEQGSLSVRILKSSLPTCSQPRDLGAACSIGGCCSSGSCVDRVCCSTSSCPLSNGAQEYCDMPGSAGACALPGNAGDPCNATSDHACASDLFCPPAEGFCCTNAQCAIGLFCNTGSCAPPAINGTPCNSANTDQCASENCTDGVCCQDDGCPAGQACNIPGFEGACALAPTPTPPVAPTPTPIPCVGACDGGDSVEVDDLVTMVNIALGLAPVTGCAAGDADGDGHITVDEIITAVNNALNGC